MSLFSDFTLRENNLYVNGKVIEFALDGEAILTREKIVYVAQESDIYDIVKDDTTLTRLAYKWYGKIVPDASKWWWVIADANNIYDPFDLADYIGKELLIPNILTVKLQLSLQ